MSTLRKTIARRIVATTAVLAISVNLAAAQESTIANGPAEDASKPPRNWGSQDVVQPAPLGAESRDLNNIDPTIFPYEGEEPSSLGSASREMDLSRGSSGPTTPDPEDALGGNSRSNGARIVGTIYQMPDGQLRFVLRSNLASPLGAVSRDDPDVPKDAELVDPPVMTGGSYSKPLGHGSRGDGSKSESDDFSWPEDATGSMNKPLSSGSRDVSKAIRDAAKEWRDEDADKPSRGSSGAGGGGVRGAYQHEDPYSGSASGKAVVEIELTPELLERLVPNSRSIKQDEKGMAPYSDEAQEIDGPAALTLGERPIDYQVSHFRNISGMPINFKVRWGNGPWKSRSLPPGRDWYTWNQPVNGLKSLTVKFDADPGLGARWVTYQLRTYRSPTTEFKNAPTELFVKLPNGLIDLRKNRS